MSHSNSNPVDNTYNHRSTQIYQPPIITEIKLQLDIGHGGAYGLPDEPLLPIGPVDPPPA